MLLPPVDIEGPRVRLGLTWTVVVAVALVVGPLVTSLVFAGLALAAAGQSCRSWRASSVRPYRPVAVGGAVVCALAGAAGPEAVAAAAVLVAVTGLVAARLRVGGRNWDARATIAIAVVIGTGAAAPAIVRGDVGFIPALVLVGLVHAVDASAYLVGSGAASRWEGPVAGMASAGALGLFVAAALVPPFRGASPWVLAAIAAILVPAGGIVATMLIERREAPLPALRRLDGYLATGPVWALAAHLLL